MIPEGKTARDVYEYLKHLVEVKSSITYPELEIDKENKLFHISDEGKRVISLTEENYKIYQEL
jgi:hypothetical protein